MPDDHLSDPNLRGPDLRGPARPTLQPPALVEPQPPFQSRNVRMIYLEGRLPLSVAASLLPPGFVPADTGAASLCIYEAPDGWGLAPYASSYARLDLKGLDSPDGSPALFILAETMTEPAATLYARHMNSATTTGPASVHVSDDGVEGLGTLPQDGSLAIRVSRTGGETGAIAGAHTEIVPHGPGHAEIVTAYSCQFEKVQLQALDWTLPPGHALGPFRDHFTPSDAWYLFDKSFSNGLARPFQPGAAPAADPQPAVIDLLGRLNLPALVLTLDGRLAHATHAARRDAARLDALVHALRSRLLRGQAGDGPGQTLGLTLRLTLPQGETELVRLIPLPPTLWSVPAFLVLLADLDRQAGNDPLPMLALLGLTPAEARIALPLAAGASAPQVAGDLRLSPHTVRSSLKSIYGKLGLSSRAELARLVDRLTGPAGHG